MNGNNLLGSILTINNFQTFLSTICNINPHQNIRIKFYLREDNSPREFRGRIYVKFRGKIQKNSEELFSMEIQRRNSEEKISKGFRGGSRMRNMQDTMRFQKSNSAGIQMRK